MPLRGRPGMGPSGAALLRSVRTDAAAGWKPGLTLLTGEDLFHLDAAKKILLAHLVPEGESDFALSVFGEGGREGKTDVAEVVAAARSTPMFAERRVVFVRDGSVLEGDEKTLMAYAASPPAGSYLLVRAPKLDLRRALHKTLAGAGRTLEFRPTQSVSEYRQEIGALAQERGLTLDSAVTDLLVEASAGDLYRVASELDKVRDWLGTDAKRVTLDAFREVGALGGLLTVWEVADALLARDPTKAVTAMRRLLGQGEEPIRVLGGLAFRARTLLQAKAMAAAGASPGEIASALRAWNYSEKLQQALDRYSLADLLRFPARLLEADRFLKSRSLDARAVLEDLVRDLTRGATPRAGEPA